MGSIRQLLARVPDAEIRMRRLNRFVTTASEGEVVLAIERAAQGTSDVTDRVFYTALVQLLLEARPRPTLEAGPFAREPRKEWPGAARIAGLIGVATRLHARYTAALLREMWTLPERSDARMLAPHISIEHLPLGVRRERARSPDRERFAPLLVETHPSVVTLLARNTRLRELDAVRMCALRPQHPYALWALLLNPRWLSSPRVLEAVALNPACKPWMLMAAAPLLPPRVVARALRSHRLPVRQVAPMAALHGGALNDVVAEVCAPGRAEVGPLVVQVEASLQGPHDDLDEALADAVSEPPPDQLPS